ncbi:hypothetical protein RZS28_04600 [Methylocapsa polymorpha]|uniref:Uncharacterized protein n=1 Tax=Methylocapsa polymorpha TaxID=3080828 RepID=A0ABZ0HVK3_9HYPH|nr:hypothetical protein RZS28_04600 [Methylocapsa sp. RX1]
MALTIVMFFVLIALYVAMFGVVKFAENIIAKPLALLDNGDVMTTNSAKSSQTNRDLVSRAD